MSVRRRTRARRVAQVGAGGDGGRASGLPQPPAPRGESPSCPPPPPGPPAAPLGPCPSPVPSHRSPYRGLSSAGPPQPRGNEPRQDPLQPQRGLQQKGLLSVPQAPGSGPGAPGGMESLGLPAVTLRDGTMAYLQQAARGEKLIEGQVIELEDGTTAYIHQVTVQKESVALEDGQPVVLEDGSMAYIHSTAKDGYDPGTFQAIQVETCTAYVHRPVIVAPGSAILEVQTGTGLEELAGEEEDDAFGVETTNALQQYSSKGSDKEEEGVTDTCRMNPTDSSNVPSQDLQEEEVHSHGKGQQVSSRAFPCGYKGCGRLYTTAHHRKVHERAHTGDRPYTCDFPGCGKAFATGYGLKSHMRTHTGEKPYKCPEDMCSKAFRTSGDLQKHIRTHTGERPFKCPFVGCGRSFTTSNIRKVHVRTHTGERPYTCPEPGCGRGFTSATNYKNHIRIHTGEKPYLCTVPGCGKRFTEYSSLYKHHVVHTHCKPYTCSSCGKTYRQTSTLAMHKRSSHGKLETMEDSERALFEQLRLEVAAADRGCPLKSHYIAFLSEMEEDEEDDVEPTQVSLISQDGTEQVSLSQEELRALGSAISVVTQSGALAVPKGELAGDTRTVTVANTDGTETQGVTVVASGAVVSEESAVAPLHHQQVALLATAHGTQITVQLEEQQSLEEGVSMAAAVIPCGPVTSDTAVSEKGS